MTLLPAAPAAAGRGQSVNLSAGVTSLYDDNVLEYSDNQLRVFADGLHPLRYAVKSTDDVVFEPELALTWQLDQGRGRRHALRWRGEGDFHARNGTADFRSMSLRWTESFSRDRRFSAGYYRLADFYVRQLRDEDLPAALGDSRYRRAQFDLQIASASWQQRLGRRTQVGVAYQHEDRSYNQEFRERDSGTHQGEVRLGWARLPKRGGLDLHLGYRSSDADGTDGDEATGIRDDDDVSYKGIEGGADYRLEFTRRGRWRVGGDLGYGLETRKYDSDLPADTYHFGRSDLLHAFEAGLRLGYRPHLALRGFYRFTNNTASLSTVAPPTSDSGSYRVNQAGLAVEWSGDLWHQAPPDAQEGDE
jgi:hypothetical protein